MIEDKLDRLNELLADKALDLPEHRRTVHPNGSNFAWLQKHAGSRNKLSPELESLLKMDFNKVRGKT